VAVVAVTFGGANYLELKWLSNTPKKTVRGPGSLCSGNLGFFQGLLQHMHAGREGYEELEFH
jgi:hypothetical protein